MRKAEFDLAYAREVVEEHYKLIDYPYGQNGYTVLATNLETACDRIVELEAENAKLRDVLAASGFEQSKVSRYWHEPDCLALDIGQCTCCDAVKALRGWLKEAKTND
jgi:hypothetical protein